MKNPKPCYPTDLLDEMGTTLTSEKMSEAKKSNDSAGDDS
jgi:hypothetical protein